MERKVIFSLGAALCMGAAFAAVIPAAGRDCASLTSPDGSLNLVVENGQDGMFWSLKRLTDSI